MKVSEFLEQLNEKLEFLKEVNGDEKYDPEIIYLDSKKRSKKIIEIDICEKFNEPEEYLYISCTNLNSEDY